MKKLAQLLTLIYFAATGSFYLDCRMPTYDAPIPSYICTDRDSTQPEHRTQTIHVIEGQPFTIALDCKPAPGYTWYVIEPVIEDYIQLLSKTVIPYRCPDGKSKTIFRFQALREGRETLIFAYAHPWGLTPAQKRSYTILIRKRPSIYERIRKHTAYNNRLLGMD